MKQLILRSLKRAGYVVLKVPDHTRAREEVEQLREALQSAKGEAKRLREAARSAAALRNPKPG